MEDREGKIFAERAERIAQKLTKALANEIGKLNDDEFSTDLLMYVLARGMWTNLFLTALIFTLSINERSENRLECP